MFLWYHIYFPITGSFPTRAKITHFLYLFEVLDNVCHNDNGIIDIYNFILNPYFRMHIFFTIPPAYTYKLKTFKLYIYIYMCVCVYDKNMSNWWEPEYCKSSNNVTLMIKLDTELKLNWLNYLHSEGFDLFPETQTLQRNFAQDNTSFTWVWYSLIW